MRSLLIVRDVTSKVSEDHLDQIINRMKRIYGSVTHDLLNPYASIIVTAEMLLNKNLNEETRLELTESIMLSAEITHIKIKELLDSHMIENGQF